ncbi:MAG: hypothetical protein WCS96_11485 [Victivallales bacterium]
MQKDIKYAELEQLSWADIRAINSEPAKLTYSVHMPLNMPYSDRLIYCDPALNAYVLSMPPDVISITPASVPTRNSQKTMLLSFAIGKAPAVPDFRKTKMRRIGGKYPQVIATYFANGLLYEFEYCTAPDNTLWIRASVTNQGVVPVTPHIRCKAGHYLEKSIFNYHYTPFYWDNSKWLADDSINFATDALIGPNGVFGKVIGGEFAYEWEEKFTFEDSDFNNNEPGFTWPCWTPPAMRIKSGERVIHFSAELQPGEKRSFTMAFLTGKDSTFTGDFNAAASAGRKVFDDATVARFDFGDEEENNIFSALQWCNLQLLNELNSKHGHVLQPCQGGTSERFYVWVWEAMQMLRSMVVLGHFAPVRRVLEYILTLQDGECPPVGEYTSLKGSIGTTANRWANSTGAALLLAADYVKYSGDTDFVEKHMDDFVRAAKWIIGEVKATRKPGLPHYGLLPKATATDGDDGYVYAFSDSWSCAGLEHFMEVLKEYNHPEHEELTAETSFYHKDIDNAVTRMRRDDGYIARTITSDGTLFAGFDNVCNALNFLVAGIADAYDQRFVDYVKYLENNRFDGPFCGSMTHTVKYIGNNEQVMNLFYMRHGEWKKAWTAARTFRRFGMTPDLYLTQERCSVVDAAFTPWQPNGSNNGRFLETMISKLYLETGNGILILGGLAPFEFEKRKTISIRGLQTTYGKLDLTYKNNTLTLLWEKLIPENIKICLPEYFQYNLTQVNSRVTGDVSLK